MGSQSAKLDGIRLPAVDRALDLLELLSGSSGGIRLAHASRKLGIPKSTAHYLIYTLLRRDYIRRTPNSRIFILGPRIYGLTNLSDADRQLRDMTGAELKELTDRLKLIAMIAGLRGAQVVLIGQRVPSGSDGGGTWPGHCNDVHCTSLGKALIAQLPDSELEVLLCNRPLARFTANTICSLERLREHLAAVRENGYAVNDEEHISGVRAIATPVFNHVGKVVASLGVCGSSTELPKWRIPTIGKDLISVSAALSRKLLEGIPREV
jgi:DNA-binding IclR family transcriptional regulator